MKRRIAILAAAAVCASALGLLLSPSASLVYTRLSQILSASWASDAERISPGSADADPRRSSMQSSMQEGDAASRQGAAALDRSAGAGGANSDAAGEGQIDGDALAVAGGFDQHEGAEDEAAGEEDEEERRPSIAGWVQDEEGEPVTGLDVALTSQEIFPRDGEQVAYAPVDRVTRTDGQGFFAFSDLPDGLYEARTEPSDRYSTASARLRAGEESAVLVVSDGEASVTLVFGSVWSAEGQPIADAQVTAAGKRSATSTDAEGFYELEIESRGERRDTTLRFLRRGYREGRVVLSAAELRTSGELQRDATLEPLGGFAEVRGQVTGRDGSPVSDAIVQLSSSRLMQRYALRTDLGGRFWMPEVEVGSDYRLWVQARPDHRDHLQSGIAVDPSGLDLPVRLEGLGGSTLAGSMVDAGGRPLPGQSLWLRSGYGDPRGRLVTSGPDGRFLVEDLPEGPLALQSGAAPHLGVSGIQMPSQGTKDVRIVLDIGIQEIGGRVVDDHDTPVSGSEVALAWSETLGEVHSQSRRSTFADAGGWFLFTGLGPGSHTIHVSAEGYRAARLSHEVGVSAGEVVVRLIASSR